MKYHNFIFTLMSVTIAGCGKVTVDSGRNANPPKTEIAQPEESRETESNSPEVSEGENNAPANTTPSTTINTPVNTGNATTSAPVGKVICFGTGTPTAEIESVCKAFDEQKKSEFATAYKMLCVEKQLVNLILPQCGWTGTGSKDKFSRIVKSTPVGDQSTQEFYFLSAHSLTLAGKKTAYADLVLQAYSEPDAFRAKYAVPKEAKITADGNGVARSGTSASVRYHFEVSGLTKTKFLAEARVLPVSENTTIIFNRAIGQMEGLKARNSLNIESRLADGRTKLLWIEERIVPDGGQHPIALSKMMKLDSLEIENRVANNNIAE
jgi:hypothetical protein